MSPYSLDLRHKIVHACEQGASSQRAVAERFDVSQTVCGKAADVTAPHR